MITPAACVPVLFFSPSIPIARSISFFIPTVLPSVGSIITCSSLSYKALSSEPSYSIAFFRVLALSLMLIASSIAGSIRPASLFASENGTLRILATPLNAAFAA